jgi:TonB-linked SusC/RagA family outer membrane protein
MLRQLTIAAIILIPFFGRGQTLENIQVTVDLQNENLTELFKKIEKQTKLTFAYIPDQLKDYSDLTIPSATRSVKETLDLALKNTKLSYRQSDNSVVIFKKESSKDESDNQSSSSSPSSSSGQSGSSSGLHYVSGRVVDSKASAIPGVNILIRGTSEGTVTDADGKYSLQVTGSDLLLFSFIGFKKFETEVGERTVIDVTLEEEASALKEVVINGGYYETTDELKTGSIVKVTAKDIEKQPVTSPLMALQGRVAGLEITPSSGAPGAAPKIRIRGTNSLRQNRGGIASSTASLEEDGNYPLYVIDGVPVNSVLSGSHDAASLTPTGSDPLSTINPSSIESIEVLKDGDATAMYGSRGANGVILIKTKRSKQGEQSSVNVSVYTGIGSVSNKMKVLDTKDYVAMRREALSNSGLTPQQGRAYDLYAWDTTRSTNWQEALLGGSAHINDIQSDISSGTQNTSFRFNGGYHRETLIFPGDFGYHRLSGQLSVNHASTNQKFRMSLSSSYGLENSHFFSGDLMYAALTLPPNAPSLYNSDGSLNWQILELPGESRKESWTNPLSYLKVTQDGDTRNSISSISLNYEVLPGLVLSSTGGYTDMSNSEIKKTPQSSVSPISTFGNVRSTTVTDSRRSSWIIEPKVSYVSQLSDGKLSLVLGGTFQRSNNMFRKVTGSLYASDALLNSLTGAGKLSSSLDEVTEYSFGSLYGRLGYTWRERYIVNLTGRRDGSSRFGPGKRFGNFGSVGAAWIFSGEKIIQEAIPFMNFGKIRASYGATGSDNIGDYNYYNLYNVTAGKYGNLPGIVPYVLYNPDYAWEVTRKFEAALELSFAKNKIGLEINWYQNQSSNQLVSYPLSKVTGFESVQTNFNATVQNSGWEIMLRGDLLNSNSWRWNASVNVSIPRTELVKFDGIDQSPYANIYKVGEPLSVLWYYTLIGVNKETGLYSFVDQNGDGLINSLDRTLQNLMGNVYYGGINNSIQYKNLEVSFLFQFSHARSTRYLPSMPGGLIMNQPIEVLDRWRRSGDEAQVQKFVHVSDNSAFSKYDYLVTSNYNSVDASFIRLKTLSIAYHLPNSWTGKVKLQEAKLFLQGQNLITISDYPGLDPETGSGLPPLRILTLGLQLKI